MKDGIVTIALIQLSSLDDSVENVTKSIEHIKQAADNGAQIIILQELFSTPYFCQTIDEKYFELAQPIPGPLTDRFCVLAQALEVVIVAPLFEKRAVGVYHNSVAVIDADGSLMGASRKKHIPDDPGFYEKYYFTPGDDGYQVFDTKYAKLGPLICWDQWYPEAARITALKGAELLIFPSAIGTLPEEDEKMERDFLDAWQTMQRSHAIANSCFVASVNRVGQEGDISFWGHSFVAGPFGKMMNEAGIEEQILISEINLSSIEKQRQNWPFFRDRRIDTYKPILKRFID